MITMRNFFLRGSYVCERDSVLKEILDRVNVSDKYADKLFWRIQLGKNNLSF